MTLGIRGTPKILIILLGVWLNISKILGFDRRREAAAGQLRRAPCPRSGPPAAAKRRRSKQNIFKIISQTPNKIFKI